MHAITNQVDPFRTEGQWLLEGAHQGVPPFDIGIIGVAFRLGAGIKIRRLFPDQHHSVTDQPGFQFADIVGTNRSGDGCRRYRVSASIPVIPMEAGSPRLRSRPRAFKEKRAPVFNRR